MFHGKASLKSVFLFLVLNTPSWVQAGIDPYIPHRRYQVKPHSSPWFLIARAAAIAHRNHLFLFYQQNKSSASKLEFRKPTNCCKEVFEATKFVYFNKTKEAFTSKRLLVNF